jgi:endonuclease YncB( thermonuclease family)
MQLGLTTEVHEITVTDGDTVKVKIIKEIDIRLLPDEGSYDAPEISHPKTKEEKERGLAAKEYLAKRIAAAVSENAQVVVYIPFEGRGKFKDITTLGRVLGKVYINGENILDEKMLTEYRK